MAEGVVVVRVRQRAHEYPAVAPRAAVGARRFGCPACASRSARTRPDYFPAPRAWGRNCRAAQAARQKDVEHAQGLVAGTSESSSAASARSPALWFTPSPSIPSAPICIATRREGRECCDPGAWPNVARLHSRHLRCPALLPLEKDSRHAVGVCLVRGRIRDGPVGLCDPDLVEPQAGDFLRQFSAQFAQNHAEIPQERAARGSRHRGYGPAADCACWACHRLSRRTLHTISPMPAETSTNPMIRQIQLSR